MSPYEIGILLHYHFSVTDHPDLAENPPVWQPTIRTFISCGLMCTAAVGDCCYALTEKGRFYVTEGLCKVPLPVATWSIPKRAYHAYRQWHMHDSAPKNYESRSNVRAWSVVGLLVIAIVVAI